MEAEEGQHSSGALNQQSWLNRLNMADVEASLIGSLVKTYGSMGKRLGKELGHSASGWPKLLLLIMAPFKVHPGEQFNGHNVHDLLKFGAVDIRPVDGLCGLVMSKLLLQIMLPKSSCGYMCHVDDEVPEAAYFPPAEVMRSIRDYHGGVQQLSHIWSFVVNFNALASLTLPISKERKKRDGKSRVPNPVTMAALRPGAVLLEPEDVSLLTEELEVERDEGHVPKLQSMMRVTSWLEEEEEQQQQQREIKGRVALHDIVNQERFTAGLTTAGPLGIDAWARVGQDKVVLFQAKGQQGGPEAGQLGSNGVLAPEDLHEYIANLMLSAFASADGLVKHNIRAFCKAQGTGETGRRIELVKSIQTWLKWNKTTVMAELLVVPDTSSTTKKELPRLFKDTFVETFIDERRVAKEALLFELHEITCDGSGDDDDLSSAVSELKSALEAPVTKKHVPSVLVVFRDRFDTALGDVFGGIMGRTVEQPLFGWMP